MSRLPNLKPRQVIKALRKAGFEKLGQTGSHLGMHNARTGCKTTVPIHPGDVKRPLLKKIIKDAGLSEDEFRELL